MSRDLAKVFVLGRLVRDVEVKTFNSGASLATFSVASNYGKKVGDRYEDEVSYFDVEAWRGWEPIQQYLTKGQQVVIDGDLRQQRWENKEGQKRSKVVIVTNSIQLVGGKNNGASNSDYNTPSVERNPPNLNGFIDDFPNDGKIPF